MFSGVFVCHRVVLWRGCHEGRCHEGGCREGRCHEGTSVLYYRNAFLLWKVVNLPVFSACGGDLTSEHGAFNSPQYPAPYPNNRECIWTIKASPGNSIIVTFRYQAHLHWEKMEVEPKKDQWKVKKIKETMTNIKEFCAFASYFGRCERSLTELKRLRTVRKERLLIIGYRLFLKLRILHLSVYLTLKILTTVIMTSWRFAKVERQVMFLVVTVATRYLATWRLGMICGSSSGRVQPCRDGVSWPTTASVRCLVLIRTKDPFTPEIY